MKKVICIIFIYTLLLLSGTDLSADQKFLGNGNGHYNGYGYGRELGPRNGYGLGHWFDKWRGPGNGNGWGHGYDIGDGPGNGYGFGHTGRPPGTNAPEPISSALFVLGGVGLGLYKKFKNKN
jgi:hypothetical protein